MKQQRDVCVVASVQDNEPVATPASQPVTPLPQKQMFALTVVLMTESICGTMLLPFVPRLIAHMLNITVEEAGYYTGILIGLFMLGQVVSCKLWGFLSDRYGRKLPLTAGLVASAFCMLFFGYTTNFWVCCVLRFLHGFFNGNVLVAKTMIADITDRTNEAKGFALVSITWGVGTLFGPVIGGFLYNPSSKSYLEWLAGGSLRDFFDTYPAFLPSFTIFLYTFVALAACLLLLRETNIHRIAVRDTALGRRVRALYAQLTERGPASSSMSSSVTAADVVILSCEDVGGCSVDPGMSRATRTAAVAPAERCKLSYVQAMRIDALRNITMFYMMLAAADMTYGEILPLWGNASTSVNGMGLTENAVAVLILSYSIPSIIANIYFHNVCALFKNQYLTFWRASLVLFTACTFVIPLGSQMGDKGYYYVMLLGMVRHVGLSWCYSLIHMLTAKAAPLGCVGAAYGISQSMAAATRCVVPFVAAPLFAWSLREGQVFPFNYYLVFLIAGVPSAVSAVISFYVEITRTEECELDAGGSLAAGEENSGEDGDQSDGGSRGSTCVSLVASFCTNPLHDTYVNMPELERANAESVRKMHAKRVHDTSGVVSAAEERRRYASEAAEELPVVDPATVHAAAAPSQ